LLPVAKKTKCKNSHKKIKLKIELNWIELNWIEFKFKLNSDFKKKFMKKIL
jgi:hypothetical protein